MEKRLIFISYWMKKYPMYISKPTDKEFKNMEWVVYVECEDAWFYQEREESDLLKLIDLMPDLIEDWKKIKKTNDIHLRIKTEDKLKIEKIAKERGYKSVSKYIVDTALQVA